MPSDDDIGEMRRLLATKADLAERLRNVGHAAGLLDACLMLQLYERGGLDLVRQTWEADPDA